MSAKFIAIVVESSCGGDASVDVHELNADDAESARAMAERVIDKQGGTSHLYVIHALGWEELDPYNILRKQVEAQRQREADARAAAREAKLLQLRGQIAVLERLATVKDDDACVEYARREIVGRREELAKLEAE